MVAIDVLFILSRLLIILLGMISLIRWVLRPDRVRRDTALMLNTLAVPMFVLGALPVNSSSQPLTATICAILLTAHPYLLFQLLGQFQRPSKTLQQVGLVGFLASSIMIILVTGGSLSSFISVPITVYVVAFESISFSILVQRARRSVGVTQKRAILAAAGTLSLGLLSVVLVSRLILPENSDFIRATSEVLFAVASICFFGAFATPRWLKKFWQQQDLYNTMSDMLTWSSHQSVEVICRAICVSTARITGDSTAYLMSWDDSNRSIHLVCGERKTFPVDYVFSESPIAAALQKKSSELVSGSDMRNSVSPELWRYIEAESVLVASVPTTVLPHLLLVLPLQSPPVFVEDDLALLKLYAGHASYALNQYSNRLKIIEDELSERITSMEIIESVVLAANAATSSREAFVAALMHMCTRISASVGHVFIRSEEEPDYLVSSGAWYFSDPEQFQEFRLLTEACKLEKGMPVAGKVFETELPVLAGSVEPTDARQSEAARSGLSTCYAFPIVLDRKVGAVIEIFFSGPPRLPAHFIAATRNICSQLGYVLGRERAATALQRSEQWFRLTFEQAGTALAHFSPDGHWLRVNQKMCDLLGYSREELLEKTWQSLTHPDDLDLDQHLANRMQARKIDSYTIEKRFIHKDGYPIWVNLTSSLAYHPSLQLDYGIKVLTEITGRKEMEKLLAKERQMLRTVIDNLPVAVFVKDSAHRFVIANPPVLTYFGKIDPADVIGRTDFDFHTPELAQEFFEDEQCLLETGAPILEKEERVFAVNGQTHDIVTTKVPLFDEDDAIVGLVGVNYDVTDYKAMLKEVEQLNRELESRVTERTARLEAINHELDAFTYSVSHDLRSPLRAIHGFSHYLLLGSDPQLSETSRYYIERINENAATMGELIDTLLMLSRMDRNPLNKSHISTKEIVQQALDVIHESEPNYKAEICVADDLPPCYADATLIRQVFVNLLANAAKFSRNAEHPKIEVGSFVSVDQKPAYYVRDNGVGFDTKYADRLFGVFQRLHDDDDFEGNGAGLSIVKRIVSRHDGDVWAYGEIDRGATFFFSLSGGHKDGVKTQ